MCLCAFCCCGQTDEVNITFGRQSPELLGTLQSTFSNDATAFSEHALASYSHDVAAVDIVVKEWKENPLAWSSNGAASVATVVSVDMYQSNTSQLLDVAGITAPLLFAVQLDGTASTTRDGVSCMYWHEASEQWQADGVVLVGYEITAAADAQQAVVRLVCASVHLTDFSGLKDATNLKFLHVYVPDPVANFGRLSFALSGSSLYTTVAVILITGGCLVLWLLLLWLDWRHKAELDSAKRCYILMLGHVSSGLSKHLIHSEQAVARRQHVYERLKVSVLSVRVDLGGILRGL